MFASCGYFRGLTCPYFQSGLCERPYCHFRHVKEKENDTVPTNNASKSSLFSDSIERITSASLPNDSYFQKSVKTTEEDGIIKTDDDFCVDENSDKSNNVECGKGYAPESSSIEIEFPQTNPSFQPVYNPTPKSEVVERNPNDPLPEYCPTPLTELKRMKKTLHADQEYDPVTNYRYPINENEETVVQPIYVPIKRSLSNDSAEFPSNKQIRLDGETSEFITNDELGHSDEECEGNDADFSDDEHMNTYEERCNEKTSCQELFDTNSFDRDTVREEVVYNDKVSKKLNKFDIVSEIPKKSEIGKSNFDMSKSSDHKHSDKENLKSSSANKYKSDKEFNSTKGDKNIRDSSKCNLGKSSSKTSTSHKNSYVSHHIKSKDSKSSDMKRKPSSSSKFQSHSASTTSHTKLSGDKSESKKSLSSTSSKHISSSHKSSSNSKTSATSKISSSRSLSSHSKKVSTSDKSDNHESETSQKSNSEKVSHNSKSSYGNSSSHKSNIKMKSKNNEKTSHNSSSRSHKTTKERSSSGLKTNTTDNDRSSFGLTVNSANKETTVSSSRLDREKSSSGSKTTKADREKSSSFSINQKSNRERTSSGSRTDRNGRDRNSSGSSSKNTLNRSQFSSKTSDCDKKKSSPNAKNIDICEKEKSNKRYSIEDIHSDLFGIGDSSSDEEVLSPPNQNNEMSDSEIFQYLDESDFSDVDTYDECLKIFNENNASKLKSPVKKDSRKRPEPPAEETSVGKKRMAHESATKIHKKPVEKAKVFMSPAQVMHNRIIAMQKHALEAAAARKAAAEAKTSATASGLFGSIKKRVAHASTHLNGDSDDSMTIAITASKTEKRKAHAPTIKNIQRPTVPAEFGSKVPTAIRQRYLNLIIDECLKFITDEETAYKRGQEEEHKAYGRSNSKNIYLRMAVNTIKRLRSEGDTIYASPKKKIANSQSHEATLGGSRAAKTSFTIKRSGAAVVFNEDFLATELYKRLKKYILSEEDLQKNKFPRTCPTLSGSAKFFVDESIKDATLKDDEKICCRCGKRFTVYPQCKYATNEECCFHWGKAWKRRIAGSIETRYTCCSGDLGSIGCSVCKAHTYETNKSENTTGYMKTLPTSPTLNGDYGVYAMDCEMVYTTGGMELARVTVIGSDKQPVYETLVKPDFPLIDPNTRFSGIEDRDLDNVTTTLRNVQAVLLSIFNDQTILLGHSLESDLIAVKIIHNTVVDTSVVFPHRLGPPYKRALRNLMSDHLQRIIQNDEGGHDSNEDALACLELMQWKLKEDAKKEQRRS